MTWKDFQVMVMGEERKEVRGWRRTRVLAHLVYCAASGDKVKKSIEQFMPLPGDRVIKILPPSPEDMLRTFKIFGFGKNPEA